MTAPSNGGVLAVLDELPNAFIRAAGDPYSMQAARTAHNRARAAIAELIEAAQEHRDAYADFHSGTRAFNRKLAATRRLDAALAAVQPQEPQA